MEARPRCGGRVAGFGTQAVVVAAMALAVVGGAAAADPPPPGIAARYAGDLGFAKDPAVIFADDFESWTEGGTQPPPGAWSVRRNNVSQTRVIPGKVAPACPGGHVLEIACWTEGKGSQTGGLSRRLGNYNHAGEGLEVAGHPPTGVAAEDPRHGRIPHGLLEQAPHLVVVGVVPGVLGLVAVPLEPPVAFLVVEEQVRPGGQPALLAEMPVELPDAADELDFISPLAPQPVGHV